MTKIYELYEIIPYEDPISLAVFSTRDKAESAMAKIEKVSPGNYEINEQPIDPKEINHSDGVSSIRVVFEN